MADGTFTDNTKAPNNLFTFYSPIKKTFFPLQSKYLPSFKIRFCDIHNRTLVGEAASPTVVNLTLRKINKMNKYEYHTCYVNSKPSDNPLSFHARLPAYLSECGTINRWEITLVKSIIPKEFLHLHEKRHVKLIERDPSTLTEPLKNMKPEEIQTWIKMMETSNTPYYCKTGEISFTFNPKVTDIINTLNYEFASFGKHAIPSVPKYELSITEKQNQVHMTSNHPLILVIPITLMAGLALHENAIFLNDTYCCLEFKDKTPNLPQYHAQSLNPPTLYVLRTQETRYYIKGGIPNLKIIEPQNLLLHVDCITPSLVGNAFGQYLSSIPLNSTHYAFAEHEPRHLEYHKLNTNVVNHVSFNLYHIDGSEPQLVGSNIMDKLYSTTNYNSFFTLSFRRKKE